MSYWTSPRGILQRARDKANPYKAAQARESFNQGWADASVARSRTSATNAYAKGWNARVEHEEQAA